MVKLVFQHDVELLRGVDYSALGGEATTELSKIGAFGLTEDRYRVAPIPEAVDEVAIVEKPSGSPIQIPVDDETYSHAAVGRSNR